MLNYQKGYIYEGQTFVVSKSDIHNAKDEQFVEATALLPDPWISVEDRLPEPNKKVIVCSNVMHAIDSVSINGNWKSSYPTYWMPLPPPPKED